MHWNPETPTTFFSSGTKRLLTFFLTFSFSTRGERNRHTIFTMLTVPTLSFSQLPSWTLGPEPESQLADPTDARASRSPQTGLASPRDKSQLTAFFQKSPKFPAPHLQAWRHSHPSPISYLGFLLWHLWVLHPPRTSVKCTQCFHVH